MQRTSTTIISTVRRQPGVRAPVVLLLTVCLALAFCTALPIEAADVTGTVFEDSNRNGTRDTDEPGLEGILVSNQHDVVRTDRHGRYSLPITNDGAVVFVIKPAGCDVPVSRHRLPRFYYIHQPGGSPALEYAGVAPTGPLPESVDFPLYPTVTSDRFDVVIFADPQPRSHREIGYIRDDVVAELVGVDAAFGMTLGDIAYNDLSLLERYNSVVAEIGIPFYNVPGNHDMNFDAAGDRYALETFKRHYGPSYYAFEWGRVSFVVLDDAEWLADDDNGTSSYRGALGRTQLEWLENYLPLLPADRLVVLALHIPLYTPPGDGERVNVADRDRLFDIIRERRHVLVLTGHMHLVMHQQLDAEAGWRGSSPLRQISCAAVSGSWWRGPEDERGIPTTDQRDGVPNGYHILRFDGNSYSQRFKAAGRAPGYQMRISAPRGILSPGEARAGTVIVNVFNTGDHASVEYGIDGADFEPMTRTTMKDPFIENLVAANPDLYDDWIEPVPTRHIWTAPLPENLREGPHAITVKATLENGAIYRQSAVFEIANRDPRGG